MASRDEFPADRRPDPAVPSGARAGGAGPAR